MRHGDGDDNVVIPSTDFTDTTAITSEGDDVRDVDSVGVQLIADFLAESFSGSASDAVVASSKTWTLSEFDFTGLGGATIRVSGATNAGNNGDFVISSVSSAHVIVTTTATGLVNETFTAALRVSVLHTEDPPAGDWKVEVSNDFVPNCNGTVYGQISNTGTWSDITAELTPGLSAVTTAGSQYAQLDITARAIRYTFTPTGGQGAVKVLRFAKSWS